MKQPHHHQQPGDDFGRPHQRARQAQAQLLSLRRSLFGDTPYVCPPPLMDKMEIESGKVDFSERSKTPPIPLPASHIPRTSSELELTGEMAVADYRERVMFNRLVSGMRERAELTRRNRLNQATVIPQPQQCSGSPTREQHAAVLDQALRISGASKAQHLGEGTESTRAAFVSFSDRAVAPEPEDQDQPQQNRDDVLSKVTNEDWSIEGYVGDNVNHGQTAGGSSGSDYYGLGGCRAQAAHLPQVTLEPSSAAVPTCCGHQDEDMVFSMDL